MDNKFGFILTFEFLTVVWSLSLLGACNLV